jgi:predicted metal-dependent hydrolase
VAQSVIQDAEFGAVTVRRSRLSRQVKLKIDQRGAISISMPLRAPLFMAKSLLAQSRPQVRLHLAKAQAEQAVLTNGSLIGKSHRLSIIHGHAYASRLSGTELHVTIPVGTQATDRETQLFIKEAALKALRTQSKAYLSRRLSALAVQHGFLYTSLRFSNAGTRWGSCSSTGTISLNIWLMQLPFELIDYVIVHELCHTRHMDHSDRFWAEVEAILPDYRERRRKLKAERPYL